MKSFISFSKRGKASIYLTVSADELWLIDSCLKTASSMKPCINIMISNMIQQTSKMIEEDLWGSC